jgi:hypothetical protein
VSSLTRDRIRPVLHGTPIGVMARSSRSGRCCHVYLSSGHAGDDRPSVVGGPDHDRCELVGVASAMIEQFSRSPFRVTRRPTCPSCPSSCRRCIDLLGCRRTSLIRSWWRSAAAALWFADNGRRGTAEGDADGRCALIAAWSLSDASRSRSGASGPERAVARVNVRLRRVFANLL